MKTIIKRAICYFIFIFVSPLALFSWIEKKITGEESFFSTVAQTLSLVPGVLGSYIRCAYYKGTLDRSSWDVYIDFGSFFSHRNASVSKNIYIGAYCIIGCVILNENVIIASHVSITSGKSQHLDSERGIRRKAVFSTVEIGKNSWIGEGAIVMDDVGADCIVAAGSVVTKKAPSNILATGNPARFKRRSQ